MAVAVGGDVGRPWGVTSSNSSLKLYRAWVVLVMRERACVRETGKEKTRQCGA